MALIIETGTGGSTSQSYATVAYALSYHEARGNNTWATITTLQQEQALIRACDYIEQVYGQTWQGFRVNSTQALSFPRSSVFIHGYLKASDEIPTILINAQCEMALKAAQGELLPDLERGVTREKVGSLEVEYDRYSPQSKRYLVIDNLLKPLMTNQSSATAALLRA
jgi:hypothetical protein